MNSRTAPFVVNLKTCARMCVFVEDVGAFVSASVGSFSPSREFRVRWRQRCFCLLWKSLLGSIWKRKEETKRQRSRSRSSPKCYFLVFFFRELFHLSISLAMATATTSLVFDIGEEDEDIKYLACLVKLPYASATKYVLCPTEQTSADDDWWCFVYPALMWSHWAFERRIFVFASHSRLNDMQSDKQKKTIIPRNVSYHFFLRFSALAQQITNWVFHYAINLSETYVATLPLFNLIETEALKFSFNVTFFSDDRRTVNRHTNTHTKDRGKHV